MCKSYLLFHYKINANCHAGTHRLTDNWIFYTIYSTSKHCKRERSMEAEVEKHVPAFPADSNGAVKQEHKDKVTPLSQAPQK